MRFLYTLLSLSLLFSTLAQEREKIALADQYYAQGEIEKARAVYEELAESRYNTQIIATNYLAILKSQGDFERAEQFLKDAIKSFPNNSQLKISLVSLYQQQDDQVRLSKYLEKLRSDAQNNPFQLSMYAQLLANEQLNEQAINFFEYAREVRGDPTVHALELASLYRLMDDKASMIEEYLNYASTSRNRLNYVKNLLQNYLKEDSDLNELETVLIGRLQSEPDNLMFSELLLWLELQRKNFYGAFIQARAIDKRTGEAGDKCMQIGRIALDNHAYEDAEEIFEYVIRTYPGTNNYTLARKSFIQSKEEKIKNTFPIDQRDIRILADEYFQLFNEFKPENTAFEALRSKALLHAFYLDEIDSAKFFLNQIVNNPRISRMLISESKLDLGDLYLLVNEPWESTLLYSQVEKSFKSHPLGYEAKLRNARLNYFTGKFELAKIHLDILKKNTTRDISNDAISLGMLITDNTILDTTDFVMQEFASTELLIFQNKKQEAKAELERMLADYEFHSITDEVLWLLAKLELEFGQYETAVQRLDEILSKYAYDILADDAAFKKAEIFDFYLKQVDEAKQQYQQFLIDYPGSMYAAEARKRFRKLRGDFVN
jgi:tetratricopeptide (TPR) repeat protein